MKVEELQQEEFCVLCAPDGSTQLMTLAPDFAMCIAMCELLASKGIGQPLAVMFQQGYTVMPVRVTLVQNGTDEDAFQKFKKTIK